tara:strand:- start:287 stop:1132 length:846 start_codon:yes stop_codon:yes gene_type:complete
MNFQIAAEHSIAGLEGIKAYQLNGHAYVSKSQLCLATRDHKNTQPLDKWLDAATNSSDANGSGGFPQGFDAATCEVLVPAEHTFAKAHLINPLTAFQWFIHETRNRSEKIRQRATELIIAVGAVGFDTMVKEACGVGYSPAESMSEWIKLQPTHEKAAPINAVKARLVELGYKDRTKRMGEIINDLFYNRLAQPIFEEIQRVKNQFRFKHGTWCGPSQFQVLTKDAQTAMNTIAAATLVLLDDVEHFTGMRQIVQKLDKIQPRHRISYVPFGNPDQINLSY